MLRLSFVLFVTLWFAILTGPASPATAAVEDAAARAALPEFKTIPAARPEELTPMLPIDATQFGRWTRSQGDNGARRYSSLQQITKENVRQLERVWTYRSGDGAANIQCTPIIVDGVLYGPTPGRAIVAVDAATGVEIWRRPMDPEGKLSQNQIPARRGLVYWPGDRENKPRILFGAGDWIHAVDPKTGEPRREFGEEGRTKIPTGATASGAVYQHIYVTTGVSGDIYAYDVRSGKPLWRFHSIARGEEFGADTWDGPQSGANGWSGLSVDDRRGIAFIALGAPRPDMVGIGRLGDNLYSNCVLALDLRTGKRLWHFQDVRHDIWDLDVCAPPNLVTIMRDGKPVDVVTCMAKSGHLFVLDRISGKPIFPVRLRRAPASKLPGERTSAYQPDPELPEPISRSEFHPSMITDRTPEAREFVEKQVARSTYGFFEPFTEGKANLFIGSRGGAEWSGAAVDVPSGRLYVTSNRWVSKITVMANEDRERDPKYPPSAGEKHYALHCASCHGPTRTGIGIAPPLIALKARMTEDEVLTVINQGKATMPPNFALKPDEKKDLIDYLFRRNQPPSRAASSQAPDRPKYVFDGLSFWSITKAIPASSRRGACSTVTT